MESFWSVLRELLEKFIVLYPPFPEQATSTFLSIKGVAYLIGIICAIVVYERTYIKQYRLLLWSWQFWLILVVLGAAALGYQWLFQINSPTEAIKWVEYVVYLYINWAIALLVFLIIFLIPYDKLKSFISLFTGGGGNGTTEH